MLAPRLADMSAAVALRKESVDRNCQRYSVGYFGCNVALRKESVDRNFDAQNFSVCVIQSLSARRAWIEILPALELIACHNVALRKESVDRNTMQKITITVDDVSLSARRAWIEIMSDRL